MLHLLPLSIPRANSRSLNDTEVLGIVGSPDADLGGPICRYENAEQRYAATGSTALTTEQPSAAEAENGSTLVLSTTSRNAMLMADGGWRMDVAQTSAGLS